MTTSTMNFVNFTNFKNIVKSRILTNFKADGHEFSIYDENVY